MRTNIVIDDDLMDKALRVGQFKSKKAAIEEGLRLLIRDHAYKELLKLRGRINWKGDLDQMRQG